MATTLASTTCSLTEVLRRRAAERPAGPAFAFLDAAGSEVETLTWGGLDERARAVAAALQGAGAAGERALLLYPPGLDFVAAFLGCLYAGTVAVPAYPPGRHRPSARLRAIAADARARVVLAPGALAAGGAELAEKVPELAGARWIATDALDPLLAASWREIAPAAEDPAFLQYTSGSTSEPKGVVVTHGSLLDNEEAIRRAFRQSETSVVVGWLPLYHDMGLIGSVLQPLYSGGRAILMSPLAFLQRPALWLETITRYRATTSGGPNFAYDLCVRKVSAEEKARLDLSAWVLAFNGAEPVRAETLQRFAAAFAPCGFRRQAFYPCYGLAEATLFVAGGTPAEPPIVRSLDARPVVGCGRAASGQTVAIVDPDSHVLRPPGQVGEIWVAGPSVAAGYWGRPEETERTFRARLADAPGAGPFLRTGDLGFLAGDELFVTGRSKDLVILRGRNHYPQDLERTAEGAHPALRPGCGAAFSIEREGEERLVVVQEIERAAAAGAQEVVETVRRAVAEEHEVAVEEVVLLRAGTILKTSSGKIRRAACRAAYLAGELAVVARSGREGLVLPEDERPPAEAAAETPLAAVLAAEAARVLRREVPDSDLPLTALGLDSLAAAELRSAVAARTGVEIPLALLLEGCSLRSLAAAAQGAPAASAAGPLLAAEPEAPGEQPLSEGQRALWFVDRLDPAAAALHLAGAARVQGGLDEAALRRALLLLAERHPALRTTFATRDGEPVRRVHARLEPDFAAGVAEEGALPELLAAEAYRPFDLEQGPLLRLRAWTLPGGASALLLAVHHLVMDFASAAVLLRDLARLYAQERGGPPARLAPPGPGTTAWVRRQEETLAGPRGEVLRAFWRERLAGDLPVLDLPTDRPRPATRSWRGHLHTLRLHGGAEALRAVARARGVTLYAALLAGLQAVLRRWTGQDEALVGAPVAWRGAAELDDEVGYFVSPVALRLDLAGEPSFAELAARAGAIAAAAFTHGDAPFPWLARELRLDRDAGASVLRAMLVLQPGRTAEERALAPFALGEAGERADLGGLALESLALPEIRAQLDLLLMAAETADGGLLLSLQLDADLFDPATGERLLGHLGSFLRAAAADPERAAAEIEILSAAERRQLAAWSSGPAAPPPDVCLHELIAEQAARTPEATALVHGDVRLTYRELRERVERLAGRLVGLGVGPEVRVGICSRRTPEMVVGLLAILEAGGAYVPLDPAYPAERLTYLLADSGAALLLADEAGEGRLPATDLPRLRLDGAAESVESVEPLAPRASRPAPENLAYLIYTSGSTGRPKAVAIEHRSAVALARWAREVFAERELDGVLAATSLGFDLSVFELFVPLCWGGRVVLAGSALDLPQVPAASAVRLVNTVPSAIGELLRAGSLPPSVETVNLAGEPLRRELVRALFAAGVRRVVNLYGPSEDTTYSTVAEQERDGGGEPPIGRPIAGTTARVLDAGLRPVPWGVAGELFLGGAGLARGYLGRPELTAERFVPSPFPEDGPGARLYRTGDRVRWGREGELIFLGRFDHQVKIRGFRIEPGEVEAALAAHPEVAEAAVLAIGEGAERRLVAYVSPAHPLDLRSFLASRLPEHLVPAAFVFLDALPLTPHGKVDRKALAALAPAARPGHAPPRTPLEAALAALWAEVLGLDAVGVDDDVFALGGHSLLAVRVQARVRERLGVDLPLPELFRAPTAARLARRVEELRAAGAVPARPVVPVPRDGLLPASFAQERLWFIDQLGTAPDGRDRAAYNMPLALELAGPLDRGALAAALTAVVRRHEVLRTTFAAVDGAVFQVIAPPRSLPLPLVDLSALAARSAGAAEAEARRLARREELRPFDLGRGPLLRAALVRLGPERHLLLLTVHHTVADGWSLGVFLHELAALYVPADSEPARVPEEALPPLAVQYADFAVWQRDRLAGGELAAQLGFWRSRLEGLPELLELPVDRPRPPAASFRGGRLRRPLPPPLVSALRRLGRRQGTTLFMTLLAGFQALLGRLTGRDDVAVGSPVAGRGRAELDGLIGFFVNTLVLRGDLTGDPTGTALLARVRETALAAWAHQELPFEKLVEELAPRRALSHAPLFQVLLAVQELPLAPRRLPGLELRPLPAATGEETTAKFDLALTCIETAEGLALEAEFARDLFDPSTVSRLVGHFTTLLAGLAAAPERPVAELPLLAPAERQQLLAEWNATDVPFPRAASIPELFAAQARERPEAVALAWDDGATTYAELEAEANRLARRLLRLGVGPESLVGVALERSPELVAALLAILKAGGAYLPLDPDYPPPRLAVMVEDALAGQEDFVVLTRSELAARLPAPAAGGRLVALCLDREELATESAASLDLPVAADQLAYVLYTSGSTGRPKGVAVAHRSVVRLVRGDCCRCGPEEVFLHLAPLPFDASTLELWGPLLNGGRLALLPPGKPSLAELGAAIARHGVTTLWLTAGLFHQMVEAELPALLGVRQLLAGGDVLSPPHVERVLAAYREGRGVPGAVLINGYGPTENTTFTCCHRLRPEEQLAGSVPIGRPIANTQLYLLDRRLEPVPVGVPGELYCGGEGLARGYLHRPDWTAERFVPDPFARGERLYRTGDLARRRPDGSVEFLGRLDGQVKLRGFRIETGEIEAVLAAHPAVAQAAVVARPGPGDDRRLVAYVVPAADAAATPAELRETLRAALARQLPDYMLPAAWVVLASLPLGPTGKVDRAALPPPEPAASAEGEARSPRTPVEELLAAVWAEVLGLPRVAPEESFFELGGHSLLATRLVSRLRELLGVELPLRTLFEEPTVAGLARRLDALRAAGAAPAPPVVPVPRDELLPASFGQERLWFMDRLDPGSPVYNMPAAVSLSGPLDVAALRAAIERIAARHEVLRTSFPAPSGTPVQSVAPRLALRLPVTDLSALAPAARQAEALRLAAAEALLPFDLEAGPLLRATLVRLDRAEHILLLTVHHSVFDGWSRGIFLRELAALYGGFLAGTEPSLPPLPVQYADFAVWQRQRFAGDALADALAWWRERLVGAPPALSLPFDRPRPPVQTFRGSDLRLALRPELAQSVRELARRSAATPFMVFLAAWAVLLARWSREADLVVGTAVAGRDRPEVEPLIGLFAGNLALRLDLAGDPSFAELLARTRDSVLSAWAHREVPFERLVRELRPERDLSLSPLYQVVLTLDASEQPPLALPDLRLAMLPVATGTAKFDLGLYLDDWRGEVTGLLEYNRDLFDPATAARLLAAFERLVEAAPADPQRRVSELPLLSASERRQVTVGPRAPGAPPPPLVPHLIDAWAAVHPDAPAVTGGGRTLSFGELDRRADRLARRLRAFGVGPEVRVAVCLDRTPELIVALLGIWKAGGVYVPLDPVHPEERLTWMVGDAAAVAVLASRQGPAPPPGAAVLFLDEPSEAPPLPTATAALIPEAAAYLVYTSGSTGQPKGVVVPHAALAAYAAMVANLYAVGPGDRVLQSASPGFDLSLDEIVPCLAGGAELVLRDDAMLASVAAFLDGCRARGITTVSLPTALWHEIAAGLEAEELELPPALRLVILGGERLLPERLAAWQRRFPEGPRLLNTYGPTEATIIVTAADVTAPEELPRSEAPIGGPVQGAEVWLLGRWGEPVPLGVPGEMAVGGSFLARGYLDRPEQTAERFVPHPFPPAAGARLYRTGDLARLLPDGRFEFAGRLDAQVKVRGYRVEPGEVEAILARHPGIQSAAVVAREDEPGRARLVGYLVPRSPAPTAAEVRAFLAASLPEPLVPSDWVFLEALPLTPHGKVDRQALPAPGPRAAAEQVAPRDEAERAVAALWREALGVERVGIHDNFFDLGGHSLALARVHVLLRERLGREIPIVDLFRHPTVASLARRLALPAAEAPSPPAPEVRERGERTRAATRQGRFLAARQRLPAAPARPPSPVPPAPASPPPLWDRASEEAHAGLSRASAAFLRFAAAHPECRARASFALLARDDAGSPSPLQPWPALVARERVAEMERVSTGLVRLVKSLPRRVFGDDPARLRAFYGLPSIDLARSLIAEPNGLEGAIGRGDFLDSAGGLRCLELNLVSDLGGWQAPLWAESYLRVPLFQRFLREAGVRVACRDTVALLFAHVVGEARELGAADGEVNVALVLAAEQATPAHALRSWLAGRYAAALREAAPGAGGTVLLLPYAALRERGGRLWADGRRIHAAVELHHEGTAAPAFRCFKAGSLKLYNAPIRALLSDKRNLALLSELADRESAPEGAALAPDERELVARHLPWTRRLAAAAAIWRGREVWLPELALAARAELVLKRAREGRGEAVHIGAATPEEAWTERVERALEEGDWIVQERVEPLPYVHQQGEQGCGPHDVVWGLFVFGDRYGGGFLSLAPRAARAGADGGVVNLTRGASAGVIFEVADDA